MSIVSTIKVNTRPVAEIMRRKGLDASITLQVSNTSEGAFMPLGPVIMRFRSGATWALIEGKKLTWNDIEEADMTWDDLESLKK